MYGVPEVHLWKGEGCSSVFLLFFFLFFFSEYFALFSVVKRIKRRPSWGGVCRCSSSGSNSFGTEVNVNIKAPKLYFMAWVLFLLLLLLF